MDEFRRDANKHRSWQQCFLYPLFFQQDLYAIAHDHHSDRQNCFDPSEIRISNEFSFLTVKRSINRIRKLKDSIFLFRNFHPNQWMDHNRNSYSFLILEGFTVVLEVSFSMRAKYSQFMDGWKSFRSIHCLFPLIEEKFPHSNYISDIRLPYVIHPEILVRIFRRWIRDAPCLHLLRCILYECRNSSSSKNSQKAILVSLKENKKFYLFLWNSYVCECESILVPLMKRFFHSQLLSYGSLPERTHFDRKIKHILIFPCTISTKRIWFLKNPLFHYVRYRERSLVALKGSALQVKKCKYNLLHFWLRYSHLWPYQPYRVWIFELPKNFFSFLGFSLSIKMKYLAVRTKMLDNSFIADLITNEIHPIAPIRSIISFLAKERFCDIFGRPISKFAWASLTDDDILDRFDRIWSNFFHYYSGSFNKDGLYSIKYILLLSCAKTLACKHKTTIRVVRDELGSELFTKAFSKKREFISPVLSKIRSQRERFWHLDIFEMNSLANSWQKIRNQERKNIFDQ